jgi:hypothetical protein
MFDRVPTSFRHALLVQKAGPRRSWGRWASVSRRPACWSWLGAALRRLNWLFTRSGKDGRKRIRRAGTDAMVYPSCACHADEFGEIEKHDFQQGPCLRARNHRVTTAWRLFPEPFFPSLTVRFPITLDCTGIHSSTLRATRSLWGGMVPQEGIEPPTYALRIFRFPSQLNNLVLFSLSRGLVKINALRTERLEFSLITAVRSKAA